MYSTEATEEQVPLIGNGGVQGFTLFVYSCIPRHLLWSVSISTNRMTLAEFVAKGVCKYNR
jgi:hypothetical protein